MMHGSSVAATLILALVAVVTAPDERHVPDHRLGADGQGQDRALRR